MKMNFVLPTRILAGENCVKENAALLRAIGKKPLIVTGKSSAKACGALDDVIAALDGGEYALFNGIRQNPTVKSCYDGAKLAVAGGCDYILGIGGGSPLDAAKAIAVLAADPAMEERVLFSNLWPKAPLPVVCVGTTAGTGSEVTPVAVLTTAANRKKSIRHDSIFPRLSFADARYTLALDAAFVKSTAIDAFSHCVESYFNRSSEEASAAFALLGVLRMKEAMKTMAAGGVESLRAEQREALTLAALYGGLAISVTGTALCHAMGYFLTEEHALSHGNACGVYLKRFLELSEAASPERAGEFYRLSGWEKEELFCVLDALLDDVKPRVGEEEIASLEERWLNNKSLNKSLFPLAKEEASALLRELFLA